MTPKSSNFTQRLLFLFIFCISPLLLLVINLCPKLQTRASPTIPVVPPKWLRFLAEITEGKRLNIGLVNMNDAIEKDGELHGLAETADIIRVQFDHVRGDLLWEELFPEWIDEDEKWGAPLCPNIPMPRVENYGELDAIVTRVPCGRPSKGGGVRDVFRLQVNLVVAYLAVRRAWMNRDADRKVYIVFLGPCGPMLEIFRCDDVITDAGDYWVYRPDLRRLRQKVLMPVGSCQLAPPSTPPGREVWRRFPLQSTQKGFTHTTYQPKEAYVSILHSSRAYVCGVIALAQSILQTNSTRDLVLLIDGAIKKTSLRGLRSAGWKIKRIDRIRSLHAKTGAYNEWNYSKLRVWQLTEYDKVIFLDADLIVLQNIDSFFLYSQLSAVRNDGTMFNSGVMLVEPSRCMFETLMAKKQTLVSSNGGDQGFLNEVFTWWHRWPSKLNYLKVFDEFSKNNAMHMTPEGLYTIHYLGRKPWMCYRDYDCNWDRLDHQKFASDSAHEQWWRVYEAMPKGLRRLCTLTKHIKANAKKWRRRVGSANLQIE